MDITAISESALYICNLSQHYCHIYIKTHIRFEFGFFFSLVSAMFENNIHAGVLFHIFKSGIQPDQLQELKMIAHSSPSASQNPYMPTLQRSM